MSERTRLDLDELESSVLQATRQQWSPSAEQRSSLRRSVRSGIGLADWQGGEPGTDGGTEGTGTEGFSASGSHPTLGSQIHESALSPGGEVQGLRTSMLRPKAPSALDLAEGAPLSDGASGAAGGLAGGELAKRALAAGATSGSMGSLLGPMAGLQAALGVLPGTLFGLKAVLTTTFGGMLVGLGVGYVAFGTAGPPAASRGLSAATATATVPGPADGSEAADLGRGRSGVEMAHKPEESSGPLEGTAQSRIAQETDVAQGGRLRVSRGPSPESTQESLTKSEGPAEVSFYEELSYLRRAQAALRRGDAAYALGLMQSLAEIQPGGALLSERAVTKVLALCHLDREPEATVMARRLLQTRQADVYAERLARSCARVSLEESGALGRPAAEAAEADAAISDDAEWDKENSNNE